jgi:hypothetical protein
MKDAAKPTQVAQLQMPGMPPSARASADASPSNVAPGHEVRYVGKVPGGPRYGTKGVVKRALGRRALIDLGRSGTWHIPYYFLAVRLQEGRRPKSRERVQR